MNAHLKPTGGVLVEVQTTPDLDDPAVIQADFPVVQVRVQLAFAAIKSRMKRWLPSVPVTLDDIGKLFT